MGKDGWLFGVKQIAALIGVSRATVERWLVDERSGIPAFRVGGRWAAEPDKIREWAKGGR